MRAPFAPSPTGFGRRLAPLATLSLLFLVVGPAAAGGLSGGTRAAPDAAAPTPAVQLRETLGQALGEHTFLAMEAMRAVVQQTADETPLVDALESNATALASAFGGIYGRAAGAQFGRLWRVHIVGLVDYAVARQESDDVAADAALTRLATYRRDFAAFLAATDPGLGGEHEAVALQLHIDQLVAFADAEYERAFQAERVAYRHMFDLGDHLAAAIARRFPARFPGAKVAFSPSGELRLDLGRLLGEHLVLAAQAMRAGLSASPDAEAATAALAENTQELSQVIARVYGTAAGERFGQVWASHIDGYLAYIRAIVGSDTAARQESLAALRAYPADIAAFLAEANPKFSRGALSQMIGHHVEALIEIVDTYAADDAASSVAAIREAHAHMFQVAAALTRGVIAQFPDRFADLDRLPATDAVSARVDEPTVTRWLPAALLTTLGVVFFAMSHRIRIASRSGSRGTGDGPDG